MTIFNSLRKFVGIITAVVTFAAATTVNISQKQSNVAYNTPHTTEVATIPIDQPQVEQDTTVKETPAKYDPTIKVRISPDNKVTIVKSPESETEATKQTDKADTLTSPNPQLFKTIPNGINIDFGQKAEAGLPSCPLTSRAPWQYNLGCGAYNIIAVYEVRSNERTIFETYGDISWQEASKRCKATYWKQGGTLEWKNDKKTCLGHG
jgi:hypothetical protein